MSDVQQMRDVVIYALTTVAPNIDPERIDPGADLAEQLDIDSMDFLNVMVAIHDQTGIDVPERDYPRMFTLDGAAAYLGAAAASRTARY